MKVPVELSDRELHAAIVLAERELRSLPDQVRIVLRERLQRDGLLSDKQNPQVDRVLATS